MRKFLFIYVLVLVGCATATPITTPNGTPGYVIECPDDLPACYQKAAEVCPSGYNVLNQSTASAGAVLVGNTMVASNNHQMTIECK
jgi:hypothetical protein